MITGIVLATFTRIATSTQTIHCQSQRLMCLDRKSTKRHSSCNKVLNDAFYGFYLVDGRRSGSFLKVEEITDEDGTFLLVHHLRPLLEFLVGTKACGNLKIGDCIWIPSMKNSILAPRELSVVGEKTVVRCRLECFVMQTNGISGNLFQTNTTNRADFCSKVSFQETFAETDAFEYLCTTIGTDGRYTHLTHNLLQAFIDSLDVVTLGCGIFLLNFVALYEVVQYGKGHIWTECRCTITQQ